ncbi:MAG: diguanylate cyclase [Pseudomonadota bacterium]
MATPRVPEAPQPKVPQERGLLERRYALAKRYQEQGLAVFDAEQTLVHSNAHYAEIYGLDPLAVQPGMALRDILELRISAGVYGANGSAAYRREWLRNVTQRRIRIQDLNDGRSIMIVQQPTQNGCWLATHEDITSRLHEEAAVTYMATRDPLTGLVNRPALLANLSSALENLRGTEHACVMMIDLDHFKSVNDTYGHDVGDEVLKIAAARIRGHVRDTDTVARLGGDEFVVVQAPIPDISIIPKRTTRLLDALHEPALTIAGPVATGATIGIALPSRHHPAPQPPAARNESAHLAQLSGQGRDATHHDHALSGTDSAISPEAALKHADQALYEAKRAGRGTFRVAHRPGSAQSASDTFTPHPPRERRPERRPASKENS